MNSSIINQFVKRECERIDMMTVGTLRGYISDAEEQMANDTDMHEM